VGQQDAGEAEPVEGGAQCAGLEIGVGARVEGVRHEVASADAGVADDA
jgi:hypothetical protein